jgi:GNAT superfamily N-acetyltransferase
MIVENLFKPKPTVVEGSAANDYFTRRNSEEERIAGTRAPVKNKKNPANTDYSKRRAQEKKVEQGVAEAPDSNFVGFMNKTLGQKTDAPVTKSAMPNFMKDAPVAGLDSMGYRAALNFGMKTLNKLTPTQKTKLSIKGEDGVVNWLASQANKQGLLITDEEDDTPGKFMQEDLQEVQDFLPEVFKDPDIKSWAFVLTDGEPLPNAPVAGPFSVSINPGLPNDDGYANSEWKTLDTLENLPDAIQLAQGLARKNPKQFVGIWAANRKSAGFYWPGQGWRGIKEGVAEGSDDTVYPNATVIKSKNGRPVGEIYQDGNSWGCFHYRADRGYDFIDSREDAIQALKDLHQETGRSGPDYTIKGVAEAINPDITNPEFSHQQQIGDYLYVARYWGRRKNPIGLKISAYHGNKLIGRADLMYHSAPFDDFADPETTPNRIWLESEITEVNPKYQRQGIMSTMYAYARMLGNTVKPSHSRSDDAKAAWASWKQAGDKEHLTKMRAEGLNEMDKTQTPPGRDDGIDWTKKQIHLGPEHVIKTKDVAKHALKVLNKTMKKSHADTAKKKDVAEAFGPLPREKQQIRLGRHTVDIERVGLDNDYISFAWHDSQGQDHYEEVAVGDLGSYDDLIDRIKDEIRYQERQYTDQGVAEGSGDNDDIKRLKAGNSTSDGIDMQDIRLMAGEGKLTKKTVLQAIAVIRKQREQQGVAESDHQSSSKTGIYQTEVYGSKAYHSKCLEKGCDWESRRFDRIKQAQDAAKKHAQKHLKSNVKEDAADDLGTIPTTEFVKGIYSLAAEYGAEAPDPEQVKKMMVLAPNREVDIQKTFQKIIATFQAQLPKITQMMSELDAIIKQADVQEGKSDLQEIQRTKGDEEGLSTKGQNWGKETLAKIKMLPGSQRFGYTAGDAGRAGSFLTGADTIIELFDVKHPQDGLRKAGFLSLRSAPWFPIKNSYQVANVGLDSEYRGQGLGQNLYGVAMKLLGMTIVADDTQTPQARSSWLRLSQVPGVAINGYTSVFPDEWALRNNRNEIYDDSAKRLISSLLKAGGQEIGKNPDFVYVSFPVGANADQNELQALQKGITIYSARHPEDGGTQNGLYARWGGQVNEQGDDPWGPQGNFAGDKPINVGDVTMKIIQVGDIVKYLGQRARVVGMSKNRKYSRISIESEFGGITKDVLTADLKQLGQGVKEGSKRKKKKTSRSLGRYFFPGYGYYGSGESGGGSGDGGGGESINRGVAEGVNDYLWHGSKSEHEILYPQQANDTGGKEESNKHAVYATPSAKVAIAMGLTTPGSDTGMFPNDPQLVLFSGNIRKDQMVYLHKVPKNLFIKHNDREWYSKPGVKEVKPIETKAVPVDQWLHLIRQATPQDLELQKKYMKKAVKEVVHPDIFDKHILNEPTEKVRIGDFEFKARPFRGRIRGYGNLNDIGLYITAYDRQNVIGHAQFVVKSDEKGDQWLESAWTEVDQDYDGRGVAAMMYAFAKSLGNDIKPSPDQSTYGKWMWKKWGKDAKHLVGEQGMAETKKNPHTSALGKALYRDLSKQPKLSPQQVQRNKERWAQRQAERGQGVEEARMSAAQRLSNAWDKQRAKSDASLRRTPSSIPKSTPEPKKTDPEPKTVSESRARRRALMAQMLNSR